MRQIIPLPRAATVEQVVGDAESLVRRGRHAAAERRFREQAAVCARRGRDGDASVLFIALGRLLAERGRAASAVRAFQAAALPLTPSSVDAWATQHTWLATTLVDAGELAAAEQHARDVRRVLDDGHPSQAWATAVLARTCLWQGRIDEARTLVESCPAAPVVGSREAFVESTVVRVLVACGDLFTAGQRLDALQRHLGAADPLAELIVLGARLRVACAGGHLATAQALVQEGRVLTRHLHLPMRWLRLVLLWVETLDAAGRTAEASRAFRHVERRLGALPPAWREAVARSRRASGQPRLPLWHDPSGAPRSAATTDARLAQMVERLTTAHGDPLSRVVEIVRDALGAHRVEVAMRAEQAADGSRTEGAAPHVVASSGDAEPTSIVAEALRTSMAARMVVPAGEEHAAAVRWDGAVAAALGIRWAAGAPVEAPSWLPVVAALIAPSVATYRDERDDAACADQRVPSLMGRSRAIAEVRLAVLRAARTPFAVLVVGESGVGKELVARAVHHASPRTTRHFRDLNCAALPDELIESELFGSSRGAFTGAALDRPGLFEDAHGGTLFLDEIVELSARAQAKLLRVLQQREVRRLGESRTRAIDVRLVSATNRDPRAEAARGTFRADLLYRIDVIRIEIPALRERREDVAFLAARLWADLAASVGSHATLGRDVMSALADYDWPGNVRELQNVLARLAASAPRHGRVDGGHLPRHVLGSSTDATAVRLDAARLTLDRAVVSAALVRSAGHRSRAASELGVSRQGLAKLMARVGLR